MSRLRLRRLTSLFAFTIPFYSLVYTLPDLIHPSPAVAYDVRVTWLPVVGAAGYKVYVRRTGELYPPGVDVGLLAPDVDGFMHGITSELAPDIIHFIAVTSYNAARVESAFSNELSVLVNSTATPTRTAPPPVASATPTRTVAISGTATHTATRTATHTQTSATVPATPTLTRTPTAVPGVQYCGNTTQANGNPTGGWNDTVDGVPCTSGANAAGYRVTNCRVYAEVASGTIRCGLYDNRADPNKALLCESASVPAVPGWNTLPLPSCPTIAPNTALWVAMNASDFNFRPGLTTGACNQSAGASYYRFVTYGSLPNPWGARTSDTCALSLHVELSPMSDDPTATATQTRTQPVPTPTGTAGIAATSTRSLTATPSRTPTPTGTPLLAQNCGHTLRTAGNGTGNKHDHANGISCVSGTHSEGYTVHECRVYSDLARGNIRCALYADSADPNKALLCQSASVRAVPGWNSLPLSSCPPIAPNRQLWVVGNVSAKRFRYGLTTGSCNQPSGASYHRPWNFSDGFPNPWGSRTADTCPLSMYVVLNPVN